MDKVRRKMITSLSHIPTSEPYRDESKPLFYDKHIHSARLEVLLAVVMKTEVDWDLTPCKLVNSYRRFGESKCLHLEGQLFAWTA